MKLGASSSAPPLSGRFARGGAGQSLMRGLRPSVGRPMAAACAEPLEASHSSSFLPLEV
jgi:hypothetical protein